MKNKIEFNAGIYPKVMSLTLGKPIKPNHDNIANNMANIIVHLFCFPSFVLPLFFS